MKYDGYETVSYRTIEGDPSSISNGEVRCMQLDKNGQIWIGTENGLNRYVRETDSFIRYPSLLHPQRGDSSKNIHSIYLDQNETLWVVDSFGISRYSENDDSFDYFPFNETKISHLNDIVQDTDGNYWVCETGNNLYRFDPKQKSYEKIETTKGLGVNKHLYRDSSNQVWIGTQGNGLYKFDPVTHLTKHYPRSLEETGPRGRFVFDITEYPKGRLAIATNQGLCYVELDSDKFTHQRAQSNRKSKLSSMSLHTVYADYENILWLGTSREGIEFYDPKASKFSSLQALTGSRSTSLNYKVVGCVFEDSKKRIWIGTDGGGISIMDPANETLQHIQVSSQASVLNSAVIRSIDQDADGDYWICTWNAGINILTETKKGFERNVSKERNFQRFSKIELWNLIVDNDNRIWVSTGNGKVLLYGQNLDLISDFSKDLDSAFTHTPFTCETDSGEIMIIARKGVYRFDEASLKIVPFTEIEKPTVIASAPNGLYYIGTINNGLTIVDTINNTRKEFTTQDGLSDNNICSIEITNTGDVWISTNNGLNKYNPTNETFAIYHGEDGLQGSQYFTNASTKTQDGRLYFGGMLGLSWFDPSKMPLNRSTPKVYISKISLFNKEIDFRSPDAPFHTNPQVLDEIQLNWRQNFLTFKFAAISFTYSHRNEYAYKLVGFDKEWTHVDSNHRVATYTNLDPGDYVFQVKASNSDGLWTEEGKKIRIHISPPFWKTKWFYAIIAIAILLLFYFYSLARERKLKRDKIALKNMVKKRTKVIDKQNALLAEQNDELAIQTEALCTHRDNLENEVQERTRDLEIAKEKAEEANRLKSAFLANLSHEVRTPLNAIVGLSTIFGDPDLDEETRLDFAESIKESSDSLLQLIEETIDYSLAVSGQLTLFKEPFPLNQFINEILSSFQRKLGESDVQLCLENKLQSQNRLIDTDKKRLYQILNHLLKNSFEHTNNGYIELKVSEKHGHLEFAIKDTGRGIPDDQLEHVFEQFTRLEEDEKMANRGIGLGLAFSRSLAKLLGGTIQVESVYQKGSTFTLRLPAC